MNKLFFSALLCVLSVFPSCGNKDKAVNDTPALETAEQFEPDGRFATIDSLVAFLTENPTDETLDGFVKSFENQAAAIKSYWYLNHKGEDESRLDETVCGDLKTLTDSLSGGSTFDMMQSNLIDGAVSHYLTAKDYCGQYSENPLYQDEMRDWLNLEKELSGFYINLASLANWGGSIVNITSSGALAYLAQNRQEDYCQLKKGGKFADSESMTISEARADFIQELDDAKSLEVIDDIPNVDEFKNTLNDMKQHADKVVVLLDKWLESRAKLCEAEGIPESHTAHFIAKLGRRIMELIEG